VSNGSGLATTGRDPCKQRGPGGEKNGQDLPGRICRKKNLTRLGIMTGVAPEVNEESSIKPKKNSIQQKEAVMREGRYFNLEKGMTAGEKGQGRKESILVPKRGLEEEIAARSGGRLM